jgi:hypothetical protein
MNTRSTPLDDRREAPRVRTMNEQSISTPDRRVAGDLLRRDGSRSGASCLRAAALRPRNIVYLRWPGLCTVHPMKESAPPATLLPPHICLEARRPKARRSCRFGASRKRTLVQVNLPRRNAQSVHSYPRSPPESGRAARHPTMLRAPLGVEQAQAKGAASVSAQLRSILLWNGVSADRTCKRHAAMKRIPAACGLCFRSELKARSPAAPARTHHPTPPGGERRAACRNVSPDPRTPQQPDDPGRAAPVMPRESRGAPKGC